MKTREEIANEALTLLGPNGEHWHKGSTVDDTGTKVCILEALCRGVVRGGFSEASADQARTYLAMRDVADVIVGEQFPDRSKGEWSVDKPCAARFNDHPDTTFSDVVTVLEKLRVS